MSKYHENQSITPPRVGGDLAHGRSAGLDIVRCVAILFVIAGHFFINTPAHDAKFEGVSMFIQGMGRTLFQVNVPLFLILTGYLNLNKSISRKYYKGLFSVLLSYLFISVVTIFFREYYLGEHHSIGQWILKITDFSAINYAWYIEMWIGLFLLTPFLNILWKNIATRRHKQILLFTMYLICALPDMFNRYGVHLVHGYWSTLFPCAFYFIGAYIKEYQPNINKLLLSGFILCCCLINPVFNAIFVKNHSMIQLIGGGNGIIGMPLAGAFFLLVYKTDVSSSFFKKILKSVSQVSLDMYLASYMFDIAVYSYFKSHYYIEQGQFGVWFFVTVPLVFVQSYLFALVKQVLFKLVGLPTK